MRKALVALLFLAFFILPGCVSLSYIDPGPEKKYDTVRVERMKVEGFEIPMAIVTGSSVSSSFGVASGSSSGMIYSSRGSASYVGSSHASTSSTTASHSTQNTETNVVQEYVVHCLEDSRLIGIVDGSGPPQLVLRGEIAEPKSTGLLWTIPYNVVAGIALFAPITWGEEYSATIRVYAGDNRFLKEYSGTSAVRSWYHWAWWVRLRASNQRMMTGGVLAARQALDRFLEDLDSGKYAPYTLF